MSKFQAVKFNELASNTCYSKGLRVRWTIQNTISGERYESFSFTTKKRAVSIAEYADTIDWNGDSDIEMMYDRFLVAR